MFRIIGLSGSLRAESWNSALLRAAKELAPEGCEIEIGTIRGIPLYDGDLEEREGIPAPVTELKDQIVAADAILLATPEYNNSIPGVFKNTIDWLSRPPGDIPRVFHNKPLALMGATPGGFGTILAQQAWLPVVRTLRTRFWTGGSMLVSRAPNLFDADGNLTDEDTRKRVHDFLHDFAEFAKE